MEKNASSKPEGNRTDFQSAFARAADLCSRQEQCTSHIRNKLMQWKVSDDNAERIIRRLKDEKYLDDRRYALFFAADRFRLNGWGKVKIAHMLRQKRISEEEIAHALGQIEEEEYFQACLDLVKQKSATLKEKNPFTRKAKLFRFTTGRGFEPHLIYRALDRLAGE